MLIENLKEAYSGIRANKMRSLLTMLGIIIGISSVITITTIGSSIKGTLNSSLNSLGGNTIEIYVSGRTPENPEDWDTFEYPEMTNEDLIKSEMIDDLMAEFSDYFDGTVYYQVLGNGKVTGEGGAYANVSLQATNSAYIRLVKLNILKGRNISDEDHEKAKNVCIISERMAKNYFKDENPLGQMISVDLENGRTYDLCVVGVYEHSNAIFGREDTTVREEDRQTTIYFEGAFNDKFLGTENEGNFYMDFIPKPGVTDYEAVQAELITYMNEKYYANNANFEIAGYNNQSSMGIINTVIGVVTLAISVIAAISLIVGGVGVMNIMLVSITERTREIGIRMAMGAKRKSIKSQFVIEAILLCLIGGMLGILIGIFNGFVIGAIAKTIVTSMYADYAEFIIIKVTPDLTAILFSVFFSGLTGVFFGYYPANKASKMEVIDALRYE